MLSNHGGRQLDGSRSAFDQLAEIVDAVGDRIDVMMDGGVQRGTHVLKALSLGAKAVGLGRYYLFPLAAAGQPGVERALDLMRVEIERALRLMGCKSVGNWGGRICGSGSAGMGVRRARLGRAVSLRPRTCSRCGRHAVTKPFISCFGRLRGLR